MSTPSRMVVDWPARVAGYRARIRGLLAERDQARTELRTATAFAVWQWEQMAELRTELLAAGEVLRAFSEALPMHEPSCLCAVCQTRRQAMAAADSYRELYSGEMTVEEA